MYSKLGFGANEWTHGMELYDRVVPRISCGLLKA